MDEDANLLSSEIIGIDYAALLSVVTSQHPSNDGSSSSPPRVGSKRQLPSTSTSTTSSHNKRIRLSISSDVSSASAKANAREGLGGLDCLLDEPDLADATPSEIKNRSKLLKKVQAEESVSIEVQASIRRVPATIKGQPATYEIRIATPESSSASSDDGLVKLLSVPCIGLLSTLVHLQNAEQILLHPLLHLTVTDDSNLLICLSLTLGLRLAFFGRNRSVYKDHLIDVLFPPWESVIKLGDGVEKTSDEEDVEINVDFFYRCLARAPATKGGYLLSNSKPANQDVLMESEEEREKRVRREAKGKGKAKVKEVEVAREEEREEEDEVLRPPGLKANLMPFQSRSVRWLLAREGKVVLPGSSLKEGERSGKGKEIAKNGKGLTPNGKKKASGAIDDDDDLYAMPDEEDDGIDEDEMEEEEEEPIPILADVPAKVKRQITRGPLWEQVRLGVIRGPEVPGGECVKYVWLNRNAGLVSWNDPALEEEYESEFPISDRERTVSYERGNDFGVEEVAQYDLGEGSGLLSEEMGLGKTVEVISLVLLHRQPERNASPPRYDPDLACDVQPTNLTLIITPDTIISQWQKEFERHAPSVRVLRYDGIKKIKAGWTPAYIAQNYDVIVTTYATLRAEVHVARKPCERNLRGTGEAKRAYRRSMLVEIEFLRVVMDEAQMVGDNFSTISETASLISRRYSFAVTGTPLGDKIQDVQPLLRFLKIEPAGSSRAHFAALLRDPATFARIWDQVGARTLKMHVEHELVLPKQNALLVPVEFGAVEKYWYDVRYAEALAALGLNPDGTPSVLPWGPDKIDMNRWLANLRQLCCHPQVGAKNKVGLGKVLKTVTEVLEAMKYNALTSWETEFRALWATRVKRAQLIMHDSENCERFEDALKIFYGAIEAIEPVLQQLSDRIKETWKNLQEERLKSRRSSSVSSADSAVADGIAGGLALGFNDDNEKVENEFPVSDKERTLRTAVSSTRGRLRDFLFVQSAAHFFIGSCYFGMGKFNEEETAAYAQAEKIRQLILGPWEARVEKSAIQLKEIMDDRDSKGALDLDDLEFQFNEAGHGLVAQHVFADVEDTTDVLNGYAEVLWSWRESILRMIYTRVSISGEDATGDEYAERAETQEKLDIYIEAYAVLLADWRYCLTGERNALANMQGVDAHAFALKKDAWGAVDGPRRRGDKKAPLLKDRIAPTLERGDSPADILRYELLVEKTEAKGKGNETLEAKPIRTLIKDLKDASENLISREESALVLTELQRIRAILGKKEKVCDRLQKELSDFTKAFNDRLAYFKLLQELSDDVADPDFKSYKSKGITSDMDALFKEEETLEGTLEVTASKRRYLGNLSDDAVQELKCIICDNNYTEGERVLTTCGHQSCYKCFIAWRARSTFCAICKRELHPGDWTRVKQAKPSDNPFLSTQAVKIEGTDVEMDLASFEPKVHLNHIGEEELEAIKAIETADPLSSKSEIIVKHTKLLRRNDPTAKIVIFSAWNESLEILMQAFARNGLQFVRLEKSGKKEVVVSRFINDPAVAAFFLHTRSQSAGLNLTCARYVFLCEPLLHPSLELQAVGRVHRHVVGAVGRDAVLILCASRIGQREVTTVYQFYVEDTVDQRVAELRGRQNTSLFLTSGPLDSARESEINREQLATGAISKGGGKSGSKGSKNRSSEESLDDEDSVLRVLFSASTWASLQNALLPETLRTGRESSVANIAEGAISQAGSAALSRSLAEQAHRTGPSRS